MKKFIELMESDYEWDANIVTGKFTKNNAIDLAVEYVKSQHPSCGFSFVFGSTATNERTAYSDIDIAVVVYSDSHNDNIYTKSRAMYKGAPLELSVMNVYTINKMLNLGIKSGQPYLIFSILEGELIFGDIDEFNALKRHALNVYRSHPFRLTDEVILAYRESITSQLMDVAGARNALIANVVAINCLSSIVSLYAQKYTGWCIQGKYAFKILNKFNEKLLTALECNLNNCIAIGDYSNFVELCASLLNEFGGISWKKELKIDQKLLDIPHV